MLQWLLVASLLLAAQPALAQSMQGMSMGSPPAAGDSASTKAYRDAMAKMDQGWGSPTRVTPTRILSPA
jgi:hypothetical protein